MISREEAKRGASEGVRWGHVSSWRACRHTASGAHAVCGPAAPLLLCLQPMRTHAHPHARTYAHAPQGPLSRGPLPLSLLPPPSHLHAHHVLVRLLPREQLPHDDGETAVCGGGRRGRQAGGQASGAGGSTGQVRQAVAWHTGRRLQPRGGPPPRVRMSAAPAPASSPLHPFLPPPSTHTHTHTHTPPAHTPPAHTHLYTSAALPTELLRMTSGASQRGLVVLLTMTLPAPCEDRMCAGQRGAV